MQTQRLHHYQVSHDLIYDYFAENKDQVKSCKWLDLWF